MNFQQFWPSIVIALSACAAFAAGRLIAWIASRSARGTRIVRWCVLTASLGAALFFYFSPSSRYALLLPAAFALGFLTFERGRSDGIFASRNGP